MFNRELNLLIAKIALTPNDKNILTDLTINIQPKKLLSLIKKHRASFFFQQSLEFNKKIFNKKELYFLEKQYERDFVRFLQQKIAIIKISQKFKSHNCNVLFFKGLIIQELFYPKNHVRPAKDIDILISTKRLSLAIKLIKLEGYIAINHTTLNNSILKLGSIDFINPKTKIIIELHWDLWSKRQEIPTDFNQLWHDKSIVKIDNHEVYTLNLYTHICYLAHHGSSHFWYRLFWLQDFKMICQSNKINWSTLVSHSKKIGTTPALMLALELNHKLLGAELPNSIKISNKVKKLAKTIYEVLEKNPTEKDLKPTNIISKYMRLKWKIQLKSKHRWRVIWRNLIN